ncbi:hypothetical protein [Deinococcus yavapaiensis]|uniref:Uncharacterized protein n=1 Tax=Deinococcus yavapaiensis KR-236 TaxID=694435 RepID=A0A318S9U9_9DEIO|nr:hypothetical protein [Deinococcus yavapaiensis]PYE52987.1 hypothetical protein DES52_111160 [Deinococcus yavapaiensis KR-236]
MSSSTLAPRLLQRAHALDGETLDTLATQVGARDWRDLTANLDFEAIDTGGGCLMLIARTRTGRHVGLTDGEERLPTSETTFWLGVMPEVGDAEDYFVFVRRGEIVNRGGELLSPS